MLSPICFPTLVLRINIYDYKMHLTIGTSIGQNTAEAGLGMQNKEMTDQLVNKSPASDRVSGGSTQGNFKTKNLSFFQYYISVLS